MEELVSGNTSKFNSKFTKKKAREADLNSIRGLGRRLQSLPNDASTQIKAIKSSRHYSANKQVTPRQHDQIVQAQAKYKQAVKSFNMSEIKKAKGAYRRNMAGNYTT
jgi:hypothetical protein